MKNIKVVFLSLMMLGVSSFMQASTAHKALEIASKHNQSCCERSFRLQEDSNKCLYDVIGWTRSALVTTGLVLVAPYVGAAAVPVKIAYGLSCTALGIGIWNNIRSSWLRCRARAEAAGGTEQAQSLEVYVKLGPDGLGD